LEASPRWVYVDEKLRVFKIANIMRLTITMQTMDNAIAPYRVPKFERFLKSINRYIGKMIH
jgi:hypothetical protein